MAFFFLALLFTECHPSGEYTRSTLFSQLHQNLYHWEGRSAPLQESDGEYVGNCQGEQVMHNVHILILVPTSIGVQIECRQV